MTAFRHAVHQGNVAEVLQIQSKLDFIIGQNTAQIKNSQLMVKKIFFYPPF